MKPEDDFIYSNIICPISHQIFNNPVVAEDGHTYEETEINKWLGAHSTSPMNRSSIGKHMYPNQLIKSIVLSYFEKYPEQKSQQYNVEKSFADIIVTKEFDMLLKLNTFTSEQFGIALVTLSHSNKFLSCLKHIASNLNTEIIELQKQQLFRLVRFGFVCKVIIDKGLTISLIDESYSYSDIAFKYFPFNVLQYYITYTPIINLNINSIELLVNRGACFSLKMCIDKHVINKPEFLLEVFKYFNKKSIHLTIEHILTSLKEVPHEFLAILLKFKNYSLFRLALKPTAAENITNDMKRSIITLSNGNVAPEVIINYIQVYNVELTFYFTDNMYTDSLMKYILNNMPHVTINMQVLKYIIEMWNLYLEEICYYINLLKYKEFDFNLNIKKELKIDIIKLLLSKKYKIVNANFDYTDLENLESATISESKYFLKLLLHNDVKFNALINFMDKFIFKHNGYNDSMHPYLDIIYDCADDITNIIKSSELANKFINYDKNKISVSSFLLYSDSKTVYNIINKFVITSDDIKSLVNNSSLAEDQLYYILKNFELTMNFQNIIDYIVNRLVEKQYVHILYDLVSRKKYVIQFTTDQLFTLFLFKNQGLFKYLEVIEYILNSVTVNDNKLCMHMKNVTHGKFASLLLKHYPSIWRKIEILTACSSDCYLE
jgi:hypothetical protein